MKTELRECPLCGTTEYLDVIEGKVEPQYRACRSVRCRWCGTNWQTYNADDFDNWNHRPIEDGLRAEIEALQKELDELKEQYRWHSLEKDGLPELNQDVELAGDGFFLEGHFFDYEEGNEASPDIRFDDHLLDEHFALDELPKKYQWRYLNAPKEGE